MSDGRRRLFETDRLGARRDRAMGLGFVGGADVLWRLAAESLAERIADTGRAFPAAAILGTGAGAVAAALPASVGARRLVQVDPSAKMAAAAGEARPDAETLVDPCELLPLAEGGLDCVLSVFLMHWLDDPVGHLIQMRRALRPDGLAIAVLPAGRSLAPLRAAFAIAESEILGGLSPRVAPLADLRDLGALAQRAGLAMPVADAEVARLSYASGLALLRDLRAMGETSLMAGRRPLRRDVLARAMALLEAEAGDGGGRIEIEAEFAYVTGWSPGPGQPEPKRPGSATARLADALGSIEIPTGERTGRRDPSTGGGSG